MPFPVDEGGGTLYAGIVQGDGPVACHHPFAEAVPLPQEVIVFHAGVGGKLLQPVLPGHAAVDEEEVPRLQDVGEAQEKIRLLREAPQKGGAQHGQFLRPPGHGQARLRRHLEEDGSAPPKVGQDGPDFPVHAGAAGGGARPAVHPDAEGVVAGHAALQEHVVDIVAVAAQGVDRVGLLQLQHIAQGGQAVPPLFQQVAHDDQHVGGGKADLLQKPLQKGQVAVDVADGHDPAAGFDFGPDHPGGTGHGTTPLKEAWSRREQAKRDNGGGFSNILPQQNKVFHPAYYLQFPLFSARGL